MAMQPLPVPGVAIFPQFLSDQPRSFIMKGQSFRRDWAVTDGTGKPFLNVDADKMSVSHRKHLLDPATGQELCEIRRESFTAHYKYSGVSAVDGSTLFESETRFHFGGNETTLRFVNHATGGRQDMLQFKHSYSVSGQVTYQGRLVATIDKKTMSMSGQYTFSVCPGFDPFLVVALTVALDDRQKSKTISGASAGGILAG